VPAQGLDRPRDAPARAGLRALTDGGRSYIRRGPSFFAGNRLCCQGRTMHGNMQELVIVVVVIFLLEDELELAAAGHCIRHAPGLPSLEREVERLVADHAFRVYTLQDVVGCQNRFDVVLAHVRCAHAGGELPAAAIVRDLHRDMQGRRHVRVLVRDTHCNYQLMQIRNIVVRQVSHTATHCATHYTTLHHIASHCNTHCNYQLLHIRNSVVHRATHTTTYCATHYNTLHHTAPHCNTLQQTLQHTLQRPALANKKYCRAPSHIHCNTLCNTL